MASEIPGCRGCEKLQEEIKKVREDYGRNFTTIKQKIISTDRLIKQYSSKCSELETQTKRLDDVTNKLYLKEQDCNALQKQLQTALRQVETVKQELNECKQSKLLIIQQKANIESKHSACQNLFEQLEKRLEQKDELTETLNEKCKNLKQELDKSQKLLAKRDKTYDKMKENVEVYKQQLQAEKRSKKALERRLEGAEKLLKKYEDMKRNETRRVIKRYDDIQADDWAQSSYGENEQLAHIHDKKEKLESGIFSELQSVIQFSASELPSQLMPLPMSPVSSQYDTDEELDSVCDEIDRALDCHIGDSVLSPSSYRDQNESSLLCDLQEGCLPAADDTKDERQQSFRQDDSEVTSISEVTNEEASCHVQQRNINKTAAGSESVPVPDAQPRCSTPKPTSAETKDMENSVSSDSTTDDSFDDIDQKDDSKNQIDNIAVDDKTQIDNVDEDAVVSENSETRGRGSISVNSSHSVEISEDRFVNMSPSEEETASASSKDFSSMTQRMQENNVEIKSIDVGDSEKSTKLTVQNQLPETEDTSNAFHDKEESCSSAQQGDLLQNASTQDNSTTDSSECVTKLQGKGQGQDQVELESKCKPQLLTDKVWCSSTDITDPPIGKTKQSEDTAAATDSVDQTKTTPKSKSENHAKEAQGADSVTVLPSLLKSALQESQSKVINDVTGQETKQELQHKKDIPAKDGHGVTRTSVIKESQPILEANHKKLPPQTVTGELDEVKVESAEGDNAITRKRPYTRSQSRDSNSDEREKKKKKVEEDGVENRQNSSKNVCKENGQVKSMPKRIADPSVLTESIQNSSHNIISETLKCDSSPGVVTRAKAKLLEKSVTKSKSPHLRQSRKRTTGDDRANTNAAKKREKKLKAVSLADPENSRTSLDTDDDDMLNTSEVSAQKKSTLSKEMSESILSACTLDESNCSQADALPTENVKSTLKTESSRHATELTAKCSSPTAFKIFEAISDMAAWDLAPPLSPLRMSPVNLTDTPEPEVESPMSCILPSPPRILSPPSQTVNACVTGQTVDPEVENTTRTSHLRSPCQFKATAPKDAISVKPYPMGAARSLLQAFDNDTHDSLQDIADSKDDFGVNNKTSKTEDGSDASRKPREKFLMKNAGDIVESVSENNIVEVEKNRKCSDGDQISDVKIPTSDRISGEENQTNNAEKFESNCARKNETKEDDFDLADYDAFDDDSVLVNPREHTGHTATIGSPNKPIGDLWADIATNKMPDENKKKKKKKQKKRKKKAKGNVIASPEASTPSLADAEKCLETVLHKIRCMAESKAVNAVVSAIIEYTVNFSVDLMPVIASKCQNNNDNTRPVLTPQEESIAAALSNRLRTRPQKVQEGILTGLHKGVMARGDLMQCLSLCRIYTGLSRLLNCREGVCVLCYDMFQQDHPDKLHHLLAIVGVWPAILKKHSSSLQPVVKVLEFATRKKLEAVKDPQQKEVIEKYLSLMCRWQFGKQSAESISEEFIVDIKQKILVVEHNGETKLTAAGFEISKAMELLAQYQGWEWTNNWLIREAFWPMLREWSQKLKEDKSTNCSSVIMLFHIITGVSVIGHATNKQSVVELLKMMCAVLAQTTLPWVVQCSVA
ncbi:putative leucine-rich repeat-containing protein DDB_G0290503 [Ptychodera flava]|uniref:putative leucine-rich repeat-containing protein DDB_G0290503 n=1 Tax=Ptychodera flava TaxID=63121 RepID=UPI00396A2F41